MPARTWCAPAIAGVFRFNSEVMIDERRTLAATASVATQGFARQEFQ
jgi:hypothetical protein